MHAQGDRFIDFFRLRLQQARQARMVRRGFEHCPRLAARGFGQSEAIAKIRPELGHQFLLPVGCGSQAAIEEAQNGRLFHKAQAADHLAMAVQLDDAVDGVFHLRQGEHAARHGQAQQLHVGHDFTAIGLTLLRQGAALHSAHAARNI